MIFNYLQVLIVSSVVASSLCANLPILYWHSAGSLTDKTMNFSLLLNCISKVKRAVKQSMTHTARSSGESSAMTFTSKPFKSATA